MGLIEDKKKEYDFFVNEINEAEDYLNEIDKKIEKTKIGALISRYVTGVATGADMLSLFMLSGHLEYLERMRLDTNLLNSPFGVNLLIAVGVSSAVALLGCGVKKCFDNKDERLCDLYNGVVNYANNCEAKAENCKLTIEQSERSHRNRKLVMKFLDELHAEQDAENAERSSKE